MFETFSGCHVHISRNVGLDFLFSSMVTLAHYNFAEFAFPGAVRRAESLVLMWAASIGMTQEHSQTASRVYVLFS